jgi:asparagine synthase (glutamine-hydrolysing)
MCGIAGQIGWNKAPESHLVADMVRRIRHRGPDDDGLWISTYGQCVLGHARLSIIDLSTLGHQPMQDPQTGNCIVFNGEIYNFQSLRRQCEAFGDVFRSHSDTEVILALYRRHGADCLQYLRGMFALAIWDEREQRLFLARDRVGKKPLNYALTEEGLVFCSEIDPLARHPAVSREEDPEALELYLQLQYIPAPWTIYRQVRKLPPAHYAILDRNGITLNKYWEVDYRQKVHISEAEALDGLEEKLTEAVKLRMISDVPLGALLSGGVDSSLVVALMAKLSGEPIRTYSIGFREEAFNELPYAEQAASICSTHHHPDIVEGNVAHLLPAMIRHYGEPFADSSAVPSFFVSRYARQHVKVVMNGDGGDELLGGYPRYSISRQAQWAAKLMSDILTPAQRVELAGRLAVATSIPGRMLRRFVLDYAWPELRSVNMYAGFWDDPVRAELLNQTAGTGLLQGWRTGWLDGAMLNADNPIDRMLWYDNRTYLPGDLMVKMDIAAMHCGLECRSPLLDHEVIEFAARLPVHYKVNNGTGKYLIKRLAERYFPSHFVYRRKMGFGIPRADWLKGPLREVLVQCLREPDLMAPLSMPVIDRVLSRFLAGDQSQQARLWTLLMYGTWRKNLSV